MYIHIILFLSLLLLSSCRPEVLSNFGVGNWSAYDLDYNRIKFARLPKRGLILNFYSPICEPCIKELPALELLYRTAQSNDFAMFLALTPQLKQHALESTNTKLDFRERHRRLVQSIRKDIYKYAISIPFVVMEENFRIGPREIVQATPETLLFRMNPLRLEYNFIGPLSYAKTEPELLQDSRFQFAIENIQKIKIPNR